MEKYIWTRPTSFSAFCTLQKIFIVHFTFWENHQKIVVFCLLFNSIQVFDGFLSRMCWIKVNDNYLIGHSTLFKHNLISYLIKYWNPIIWFHKIYKTYLLFLESVKQFTGLWQRSCLTTSSCLSSWYQASRWPQKTQSMKTVREIGILE